jgi:hypothetical protein
VTAPEEDLVEVEVPPEQVRDRDALLVDGVEHYVDGAPVVGEHEVTVRVPDPLPIPRGVLVRVRRPRSETTLADRSLIPIDPVEYAAVRDLALSLADLATAQGASVDPATEQVLRGRERVRARVESTEPLSAPEPAPVEPAPATPVVEQPTKGKGTK